MASARRRVAKPDDRFKPFFDALPKLVNSVLLLFCFLNFGVVFWGVSRANDKVIHSVDSVTTNHWFVVTQVIERVNAPASAPSSGAVATKTASDFVGIEVPVDYQYGEVDGEPCIYYCNRIYRVGDSVSYGRLAAIYPDRIRLDSGAHLRNVQFSKGR